MVIADVDQPAMEHAVQQLGQDGVQARSVACDVSSREQVDAAVRATVDSFGSLDVLVANAGTCSVGWCAGVWQWVPCHTHTGIVRAADFLEMTETDFDDVIRINLKGVFLVCVDQSLPRDCARCLTCASPPTHVCRRHRQLQGRWSPSSGAGSS